MRIIHKIKNATLAQALPYILFVGSILGLIASAVVVYDQVKIWKDPNYIPGCNLNPLLSCGSVIDSGQGHLLGMPPPFVGLVMFSIIGTVSAVLIAGVKFNRRFWQVAQFIVLANAVFMAWLLWISLYRIHALCPFCLLTDVSVYTMAWYLTLYNLQQGNIVVSKRFKPVVEFASKHHLDILISFFLLIAGYILHHFWYYFGRNF